MTMPDGTDVGKKDVVIIHPTGSLAILRKSDYDLLFYRAREAEGLRRELRELSAALKHIHEMAAEALRTEDFGTVYQIEADARAVLRLPPEPDK